MLRKLTIVIELSVAVASELISGFRVAFSDFVRSTLPRVEVDVQWKTRQYMVVPIDDPDWVNFLGFSDSVAASLGA